MIGFGANSVQRVRFATGWVSMTSTKTGETVLQAVKRDKWQEDKSVEEFSDELYKLLTPPGQNAP